MKYSLFTPLLTLAFLSCSTTTPYSKTPKTEHQQLSQEYLSTLDFKGKEIISIKMNNQFYYVNQKGEKILTLTYDGEADPFSDGLARTKVNGKIGFFNKNLEIVLQPVYDFAFPFHNGTAEICMGCKEEIDDGTSMLNGGKWKKIDRDGLVIE